jgi:hypothetical protein
MTSDVISKARMLEFLTEQIEELQREPAERYSHMAEGLQRVQSAIERGYFDRARSTPKPHSKVAQRAPGTSWAAARAQNPAKAAPLYDGIMLVLERKPCTDDELRLLMASFLERKGYSPESVTMRRGELRDAGWVIDTGERRPGDSGSPMTVWSVAPEETP